MIRSLPVVALTVLLVGCSGTEEPAPGPPAAAASSGETGTVAGPDNPPGTRTCSLLVQGVRNASLMQPGVVDAVVAASRSADAPIADAARRLAAAYASAVAARNTQEEPDAIANVSAAGAEMAGVCNDAGLESTG